MCGIFGIWSQNNIDHSQFASLGDLNTRRGNLGFGTLIKGKNDLRVIRYATPFDAAKVQWEWADLVLGHVRAPTGGQSDNLAEIHPLETQDLLLAHNGLLLNHHLFPEWRLDPALNLDSQVIIGGIQYFLDAGRDIVESIQATVEKLEGQQACWLWHKPTQQLYLWRVMSPIYTQQTADQIVFSSVQNGAISNLLDEGMIYHVEPQKIAGVGHFSYYSPYTVR